MSVKQWLGQIDHTARCYESQSKQQSITTFCQNSCRYCNYIVPNWNNKRPVLLYWFYLVLITVYFCVGFKILVSRITVVPFMPKLIRNKTWDYQEIPCGMILPDGIKATLTLLELISSKDLSFYWIIMLFWINLKASGLML